MRKIIVCMFLTMDGVLQAPGGPEEDPSGQFEWGGWMFPYGDDLTDKKLEKIMSGPFDLLLGRRTYDIFAGYWPGREDAIGQLFNRISKYVVSSQQLDLAWAHANLITGDVVAGLQQLKAQDGPDLLVHGSSVLVQTLLAHQLIDELHTWICPITLGKGKQLFREGTQPQQWKLTDTVIGSKGTIIATYVPDGEVQIGSLMEAEAK